MFRGQKKGLEKVGVHANSYPHRFAREGTGVELLLIGFDMLFRKGFTFKGKPLIILTR